MSLFPAAQPIIACASLTGTSPTDLEAFELDMINFIRNKWNSATHTEIDNEVLLVNGNKGYYSTLSFYAPNSTVDNVTKQHKKVPQRYRKKYYRQKLLRINQRYRDAQRDLELQRFACQMWDNRMQRLHETNRALADELSEVKAELLLNETTEVSRWQAWANNAFGLYYKERTLKEGWQRSKATTEAWNLIK
jgi:hypothetical protein